MAKPDPNIPKINLYQKQRVCLVVSDKGDEFFVELLPKVKSFKKTRYQVSSQSNPKKTDQVDRIQQRDLAPIQNQPNNSLIRSPSPDQERKSKRHFFNNFFKDIDLDVIYQICLEALEGYYKRDKVPVLKSQGERFELTNLLIEYYLRPVDRSGELIDICKNFFDDFYSSEPNIASAIQEKLNSFPSFSS